MVDFSFCSQSDCYLDLSDDFFNFVRKYQSTKKSGSFHKAQSGERNENTGVSQVISPRHLLPGFSFNDMALRFLPSSIRRDAKANLCAV